MSVCILKGQMQGEAHLALTVHKIENYLMTD